MHNLFLFLVLLLTAAIAPPVMAESYPAGFKTNHLNGSQTPVTKDGVTRFTIIDRECSNVDYGDGRGENDCKNGNVRSNINYARNAQIGEVLDYSFEVRVPKNLDYAGFRNSMAAGFLPDSWDSFLSVASWEGNRIHNFMYELKLDTTKGLAFLGQTCQPTERFGEWVKFSMKIRWTSDDKGWIKVSCDDNLVYVAEGVATTINPHCYIQNNCEPGIKKDPDHIIYVVGPQINGYGHEWKMMGKPSQFVGIQDGGITVEMRNLSVTSNPVLYEPADVETVRQLQARLTELGCDPGPADGVAGKRTRNAAMACKAFPDGAMPESFNVATAATFLALYAPSDVAALPKGRLPGELATITPKFEVVVGEHYSGSSGKSNQVDAEYIITTNKPQKLNIKLKLEGIYLHGENRFTTAKLMLYTELGEPLPDFASCGPGAEAMLDFHRTVTLGFRLQMDGDDLIMPGGECLLNLLPKKAADEVRFLTTNFADIAVGFVRDGTLKSIRNDGVRSFWTRLATGEISVRGQ